MKLFSYKVEHDFGLAPNPFGGVCSLAVCRGSVRGNKNLNLGDWVIGTGSRALETIRKTPTLHHLLFAMKVDETLTFDQYWKDQRFEFKKPIINGSLVQMYGDNFYHHDSDGHWIQEDSAHSLANGRPNEKHITKDTRVDRVLLANTFYYFGNKAVPIPKNLWEVCSEGRDMKSPSIPSAVQAGFLDWLLGNFSPGIIGDPINWISHTTPNSLQ